MSRRALLSHRTTRELIPGDRDPVRGHAPPPVHTPTPAVARARFSSAAPARILMLTANAAEPSSALQLDKEARDLDEALRRARCRDLYALRVCPAATLTDTIAAVDDFDPDFLHVACHGDRQGRLMLVGRDRHVHHVEVEHFAELLALQPTRPRLVTFAACHSAGLARAAARHADHAIGFDGSIGDDTALLFSATLYGRLASRAQPDIPRAFALARLACRGLGFEDVGLARLFGGEGELVG